MSSFLPIFSHLKILPLIAVACGIAMTLPASAKTQEISINGYQAEISDLSVSFLARDLSTGVEYVLEGSDLETQHVPFSTFKIPNLVLALETGVASSLETWREWNATLRPAATHWPEEWQESQDLGTAFARSSVWYFQDLALEIGGTAYREHLTEWRYGNAVASDGSDDFWLTGELQISVKEQVDFLDTLVSGRLDVAASSLEALAAASNSGAVDDTVLHGKTGSGPDDPKNTNGSFSGWFAGYLSREDGPPIVFALHVAGPSFGSIRNFRKDFAIRLLRDAGLTRDQ